MIYTSNFSKSKKVPNPIAISLKVPKWYVGDVYKKLAPSRELLMDYKNELIDKREYTRRYLIELVANGVTVDTIVDELPDECTLLCWESPDSFCHRHIISWILRRAGIDSKEWKDDFLLVND